jgi:hypothetical protein
VAALLSGLNFAQAASDFGTRQEAVAMVHRVQWAHRLIATTDYD